ncbi:MAG: FAD-dependent oxidoreductase [Oscillospiraceae bacterium]|nr:FAD-dependent oxidoreductase [Oscillospiraceae bacterium]
MRKYSFLEPITVGHMTLKNRVVMTAMARHIATADGFITERYCRHYRAAAEGGTALIIPGIMAVDSTWPYISNNQPWLDDDKFLPGLTRFAAEMHAAGAKVAYQLWCSGLAGTTRSIDDFTLADIARLQQKYLEAARRCKQAGADAVEFHIAHTYLPGQFLSPAWNHRKDQYGADCVENATRFSVECMEQIRDKLCDAHFDLLVKINGADFVTGGVTPQWSAAACSLLEQAGAAMFTVNGGGALAKITDMSDDGHRPEGWKVYLAEEIRKQVHVPVAACGSIRHYDYADRIIREGKCDLIAIARGLFAEPAWVQKAAEGREDEARRCISCMFCFTSVPEGVAGCSVNPYAKREKDDPGVVKNGAGRRVAVVGAGPAGLEAAYRLALRGFDVTIYEKDSAIGGLTRLAAVPDGKQKLLWLADYYARQISRLGIHLALGRAVSAEEIAATHPYAVFVATGSQELTPPIDGIARAKSVRALLRGEIACKPGARMVVLGGGLTGLEAARLAQTQGCAVTVLEMLPENPGANLETKLALGYARTAGVSVRYGHKVLAVTPDAVLAETNDGDCTVDADEVILAMGLRPDNALAQQLEQKQLRVYRIGDCDHAVKISSAVQSGCDAAQALQ